MHDHTTQFSPRLLERFWKKVDKRGPTDCWEWKAALDTHGYGQIRIARKNVLAHRLSYEFVHGPIPKGHLACHSCDNRKCVNPSHIWLGTNNENIEDMRIKGRAKSGGAHGKMLPQTKLDESQVAEIRRLYATHAFTQYQLGDMFGVSRGTICDIVRHVTWKLSSSAT